MFLFNKISLFFLVTSNFFCAPLAFAEDSYACSSENGEEATLTLAENLQQLTWWNHTQSKFTIAPLSNKGELIYYFIEDSNSDNPQQLTESEGWLYKIEKDYANKSSFTATTSYNNWGQEEDIIAFNCDFL